MVPHVGQLFAARWNLRFQFTRCRGRAVPSEPRSRREEREALAFSAMPWHLTWSWGPGAEELSLPATAPLSRLLRPGP